MQTDAIAAVTEIFTTGHIFTALLLMVAVWLLLKVLQYIFNRLALRFTKYRIQISGMIPLLRIVIWAIAVYLVIAKVFNPPESTLIAMLASTGLAVGLAAQDVIRNVISGALILFEQPFRVGDMVNVDSHYGEVKSIGLRSTTLVTFDDTTITVPNATVAAQSIANSNSGALDEMVVVSFVLPASLDTRMIRDLAADAAACSPYVYLIKPVNVMIEDKFERTFLTQYTIKAYVFDVRFERKFASDVLERVKHGLIEENIVTDELVLMIAKADLA